MEKYVVYRHILPNGKSYIGISTNVFKRWGKCGEGYSSQPFYNAIKKYGWNNIKHEILKYDITLEEAKQYEKIYIEKYSSYIGFNGYNSTLGGDEISLPYKSVLKYNLSGELIDKYNGLKEAANSVNSNSIGAIALCCGHKNHTAYGYIWRYEDDQEQSVEIESEYLKNKIRKINVYNNYNQLINTFDNYIEAAKYYKIKQEYVLQCAKNKKSYHKKIFRFADEQFNKYKPNMGFPKPVVAIDRYSYNVVKTYDSISQAAKDLNISSSAIAKICKKEHGKKTANGYIFRFAEEYDPNEKYIESRNHRLVKQYNENKLVGEYKGIVNAAKKIYDSQITKNSLSYIQSKISKAIQMSTDAYGYKWEYTNNPLQKEIE